MPSTTSVLQAGMHLANQYEVLFFVKRGSYAETYRVRDGKGKLYLLKLLDFGKLSSAQFDEEGRVLEIELLRQVQHPNLVQYQTSGEVFVRGQRYAYLLLDFISGETLADKLSREQSLSAYEAKHITQGVLQGLRYLHSLTQPILHNDLTHLNVMLDLADRPATPRLIDFGYAQHLHQPRQAFRKDGLNPFYLAPEAYHQVFSPQSDIFAAGALFYHLLYGVPPWFVSIPNYQTETDRVAELVRQARKKPLIFPHRDRVFGTLDAHLPEIIRKALAFQPGERFESAGSFLQALQGNWQAEQVSIANQPKSSQGPSVQPVENELNGETGGFARIAGMGELKKMLHQDVIRALQEKELYREYGLTIPNGLLLYGPPGCGKTYFARRLAEEVGFNFVSVKPSDLASIYVHGSQEKISKLFDEAREHAPTVLYFDEFDGIVPRRDQTNNQSQASEVNEFLAQMTDCGEDGIFVIASTNYPERIDPAVLRTGRLDKRVYIPPPDFEARQAMFELNLSKRPVDFGIDFGKLALKTEGYVASDLTYIVNEAARKALQARSKITQLQLEEVISMVRPSVLPKDISRYSQIQKQMDGLDDTPSRPGIGFR